MGKHPFFPVLMAYAMNPSRFQVTSTLMNNRLQASPANLLLWIIVHSQSFIYISCPTHPCVSTAAAYMKELQALTVWHQPCLCLCFGFSQITLILPFLLMILHFSQIGFTDDLTFIVKSSFHRILPRGASPQNHAHILYQTPPGNSSINFIFLSTIYLSR